MLYFLYFGNTILFERINSSALYLYHYNISLCHSLLCMWPESFIVTVEGIEFVDVPT
jgi:hypothetical protein